MTTSFTVEPDDTPATSVDVEMSVSLSGEQFRPDGISIMNIYGCPRWEMLAFVEQNDYKNIEGWVLSNYDEMMVDIAHEEGPQLYENAKSDYADREYHRRKVDPNYRQY